MWFTLILLLCNFARACSCVKQIYQSREHFVMLWSQLRLAQLVQAGHRTALSVFPGFFRF